jgi:hypothetical protein
LSNIILYSSNIKWYSRVLTSHRGRIVL